MEEAGAGAEARGEKPGREGSPLHLTARAAVDFTLPSCGATRTTISTN